MNEVYCDEDYIDPYDALYDHRRYTAREGEMSGLGRHKKTTGITRKTAYDHMDSRPRIDHTPKDITSPSLDEGVPFVQMMVKDRHY